MERLNVLITGADNPIGERLIRIMLGDSRIRQILAVSGADPGALPAIESRLQCIQVDLRRTRRVRHLLFGPARDLAIDVVVHLALHRSAHDSGSGVHAYNVEALRSIVELSERHPFHSTPRLFVAVLPCIKCSATFPITLKKTIH